MHSADRMCNKQDPATACEKEDAVIQNKKVNPAFCGENKHRLPNGPEKRDILSDQRGKHA